MKNKIHIAFIESSVIIREGIMIVLNKYSNSYKAVYFDGINQFLEYKNKAFFSLVIMSSNLIPTELDKIRSLKNKLNRVKWLGCISNNYSREFATVFDNLIYLNDAPEKIYNIIKNCSISQKKHQNKVLENNLSKREIDVLKLLVIGKMNKEIANKLNISIHTVITHRKNITKKLGIKSTAAMVIYAVAHNIIDINNNLKLT